jgi:hypothetical protein
MLLYKLLTGALVASLFLAVTCQDTGTNPGEPDPETTTTTGENAYGIFRLMIDQDANSTSFSGALKNGPEPERPWKSVMKSGQLELLEPEHPFCENCGINGLCVAEDSCSPKPTSITGGTVSVTGVVLTNGTTSFTSKPIVKFYSTAASFADPPFEANSTITLSAEAGPDAEAFTMSAAGVERINLLNDTVKLNDGEPINLSWTPPSVAGTTVMHIEVDISYHGGTKAIIIGDCDDNGTLKIPGEMLDKLVSYGLSGFPKITMTRRAVSPVTGSAKAQLIVEATRQVGITVPGLISCNPGPNDGCPEGYTCTDDRRCVSE